MPTVNIKFCEQCFFWDRESLAADLKSEEFSGYGYCRAHPPGPGLSGDVWDVMPVPPADGWCGEFDPGNNLEDLHQFLENTPDLEDSGKH